jgi:hypothetical protein
MKFDWQGGIISPTTAIDSNYKSTQNVRRFLRGQCGPDFKFDRELMAWIRQGIPKNMGEVVDEWNRRSGCR